MVYNNTDRSVSLYTRLCHYRPVYILVYVSWRCHGGQGVQVEIKMATTVITSRFVGLDACPEKLLEDLTNSWVRHWAGTHTRHSERRIEITCSGASYPPKGSESSERTRGRSTPLEPLSEQAIPRHQHCAQG
jgi:hypothetical protein